MTKLTTLCAMCILGLAIGVWAQPGGGGRTGQDRGGGGMMALESDWATICFELKVDAKMLEQLRTAYQKAWDQRRDLMAQTREGGLDRMVMQGKMAAVQTDLDAAVRQFLTKEQLAQLEQLRAQRRDFGQRGGGRRQQE